MRFHLLGVPRSFSVHQWRVFLAEIRCAVYSSQTTVIWVTPWVGLNHLFAAVSHGKSVFNIFLWVSLSFLVYFLLEGFSLLLHIWLICLYLRDVKQRSTQAALWSISPSRLLLSTTAIYGMYSLTNWPCEQISRVRGQSRIHVELSCIDWFSWCVGQFQKDFLNRSPASRASMKSPSSADSMNL